jgi:DNA-binding NtrC family response regulator
LFGHEKGAFTGSVGRRDGLFHKADGGTIFLDEIGETTPQMQVKLLRVLEDGTYYPVGSSQAQHSNVRVISATNRDLAEAIDEKQFREDLYYRLGVVRVVLPPLWERKSDIQPLLEHFWKSYPGLEYSDAALKRLSQYDWPGNVRQLRNFVESVAALKKQGMVDEADVNRFLESQRSDNTALPVATGRTVEQAGQELIYRAILSLGSEIKMLRELIVSHLPTDDVISVGETGDTVASVEEMEQQLIERALSASDGNRKEAAKQLGIGERTLYRKLKKYGLS